MKALRNILDKQAKVFEKGGKLEKLYPLWEANDTFLYTPDSVTKTAAHVRDAADLKRVMMTVVVALIPCTLWAMYNTGLQVNLAANPAMTGELAGWQNAAIHALGIGYDPGNIVACFLQGMLYFLPVYIVTIVAGGFWEVLFALVRRHEINEGFLVSSLLFPLILPPTIPLWQVALGISFGVVFGKEVFGGTGMNIFNPALMARAFLYFAYPAQISGAKVWTAMDPGHAIDGWSGATTLAVAKEQGIEAFAHSGLFTLNLHDHATSWLESFLGFEAGSMGETSALACLIGAAILIMTGVGSWRIMLGIAIGAIVAAFGVNMIPATGNPAVAVPAHWHLVLGGLAFGAVFMATDPVSAPFTDRARWIYGVLIGVFIVVIRVLNPAYPESVMLVILFMNMFSPLIDHFIVKANIARRMARYAAQ